MGPDWLGSPQHVVGGFVLAAAIVAIARPRVHGLPVATLLALGLTALGELAIELVEYPLLYSGTIHATAYYDTIADMASTLAGAVLGIAGAAWLTSART